MLHSNSNNNNNNNYNNNNNNNNNYNNNNNNNNNHGSEAWLRSIYNSAAPLSTPLCGTLERKCFHMGYSLSLCSSFSGWLTLTL